MGVLTTPSARSSPLSGWLNSSIGKKTIVAITGVAMVIFLVGHLLGNLTFFLGPLAMNGYALHLHDLGPLLWLARTGLLAAVALHIYYTMRLWQENHAARPEKYLHRSRVQSTVFARTMRLTGLVVFAFVVFHLSHFTWLIVHPEFRTFETMVDTRRAHDVFRMVVAGFSYPLVSAFYVLSLGLLAFHLSHGVGSLFQTLGFNNQRLRPRFERAGHALAWLLFAGFSSIPIAVLLGVGRETLR